ncbi:hypothetical protein [Romboutsia lituseburensis]|uniref:hypothetical protein n=1 Tax=Romboutsia lituseburensis TaxID=1537 RepID=UPI00215B2508|nr:hypothetical protein [Romboutsia lituseburensis]MCR8745064.1 hypothetical protein [Romboutsia lituseburensis]
MKKIAMTLFLIATTLLATSCTNDKQSSNIIDEKPSSIIVNSDEKSLNISENTVKGNELIRKDNFIEMPISVMVNDVTTTKYIKVDSKSSLEEKLNVIINGISQECFNGLPMNVTVFGKNTAKINLVEYKDSQKNRVTWKDDYLNDSTKEYTINTIIKNVIQDSYNGDWIEKVQLYYNDELIQID